MKPKHTNMNALYGREEPTVEHEVVINRYMTMKLKIPKTIDAETLMGLLMTMKKVMTNNEGTRPERAPYTSIKSEESQKIMTMYGKGRTVTDIAKALNDKYTAKKIMTHIKYKESLQ